MERTMHHPEHFPQPSPTPSLEYSHHRGRQSLDHGRYGAFRHQDPQPGWAPRSRGGSGGSMRYMWSSSQGPPPPPPPPSQPSSSSSKHWPGHLACPKPSPSPAETELLNTWVSSQSASRYGYYLDRGNGFVTQLVPADMLPDLNEIPRKERRVPGMEVLQPFYGSPPPGTVDMSQSLTIKETSLFPVQYKQSKLGKHDKEYCDKWVHEGICAFTQQGCRYRHEMPYDKLTQHSLGLFHGLPSWWKKRQADLARQQDGGKSAAKRQALPMAPSTTQDTSMSTSLSMMPVDARDALAGSVPDTPWRRGAIAEGVEGKASARRGEAGPPPCSYRYPFGAIQPPRSRRSQ